MKIKSLNPTTETEIKEYDVFTQDRIEMILHKSEERYQEWKNTSSEERKKLFHKLGEVLRSKSEEYGKLMTLEMGKPLKQAIAEVDKCAWACDVYADNFEKWLASEIVEADGLKHEVIYQPLGVILSIMPWNFPFWQALRFGIPSIIVGNTTILKHSNNVPGCAMAIEDAFREAGFPENVFTTIISDHQSVGKILTSDLIQGVSLTGSTNAGSIIAEIAGKNLKKVVLELGGSDPFIVFNNSDIDLVVKNAVIGRTQNNGQSCIAAKRFIVQSSVVDEFSIKLASAFDNLKIGDPLDLNVDIGPMANSGEYKLVKEQLEDAINQGGKVLTGKTYESNSGFFFTPTLVTNTSKDMRIVKEEVFGPLAPIIIFDTEEEAIKIANDSEFGLGGCVWTKDLDQGERVALQLEVGSVFVNSIVKSDPRMPFGGVKKSGIGRELSKYGLKEFVNIKGLNIYQQS